MVIRRSSIVLTVLVILFASLGVGLHVLAPIVAPTPVLDRCTTTTPVIRAVGFGAGPERIRAKVCVDGASLPHTITMDRAAGTVELRSSDPRLERFVDDRRQAMAPSTTIDHSRSAWWVRPVMALTPFADADWTEPIGAADGSGITDHMVPEPSRTRNGSTTVLTFEVGELLRNRTFSLNYMTMPPEPSRQ